jgi:multiple sugar transport system ATP-binding protein
LVDRGGQHFIGTPRMNLIRSQVTEDGADLGDYRLPIPRETLSLLNADREVVVGLRPDAFTFVEQGLTVRIGVIEVLGTQA